VTDGTTLFSGIFPAEIPCFSWALLVSFPSFWLFVFLPFLPIPPPLRPCPSRFFPDFRSFFGPVILLPGSVYCSRPWPLRRFFASPFSEDLPRDPSFPSPFFRSSNLNDFSLIPGPTKLLAYDNLAPFNSQTFPLFLLPVAHFYPLRHLCPVLSIALFFTPGLSADNFIPRLVLLLVRSPIDLLLVFFPYTSLRIFPSVNSFFFQMSFFAHLGLSASVIFSRRVPSFFQ